MIPANPFVQVAVWLVASVVLGFGAWLVVRVRRLNATERVYVQARQAQSSQAGWVEPSYVPWEPPSVGDEVEAWLRGVS